MAEDLVIIGCGGHGREMMSIVKSVNAAFGDVWNLVGYYDDGPREVDLDRLSKLGAKYLGKCSDIGKLDKQTRFVVGIGDPQTRAKVARRAEGLGLSPATLAHPSSTVGLATTIGEGSVLFAGSRVTTNVHLGRHVHLNQNCTVGHDSSLEDFVSVNPLAAVSGECSVGAAVTIGTNSAVLQGLKLGAGSTIGAGACVVRDVSPNVIVKGVPAR